MLDRLLPSLTGKDDAPAPLVLWTCAGHTAVARWAVARAQTGISSFIFHTRFGDVPAVRTTEIQFHPALHHRRFDKRTDNTSSATDDRSVPISDIRGTKCCTMHE